jgi:hypothetical protein
MAGEMHGLLAGKRRQGTVTMALQTIHHGVSESMIFIHYHDLLAMGSPFYLQRLHVAFRL